MNPSSHKQRNPQLSARDWLLLLLHGSDVELDRVRIQKALFLFAKESSVPASQKYEFVPYSYGPFSFEVYPDMDALEFAGLIHMDDSGSRPSPAYSLTPKGAQRGDELLGLTLEKHRAFLFRIRDYVRRLGFNDLLSAIYDKYPDYAVKSVFRRPK